MTVGVSESSFRGDVSIDKRNNNARGIEMYFNHLRMSHARLFFSAAGE